MYKIKILKIGGSVFTYKDRDSELNTSVVMGIFREIKKWLLEKSPDERMVFTSGAGSFGHPLAHKYQLNAPSSQKDNIGFVSITTNMQAMGNLIAKLAHAESIPLLPIPPSSVFLTDNGRIISCAPDGILRALEENLIPFFWGDAVFDVSHRYRVLSGDQINTYLFDELNADTICYGTNVDGIFRDDPSKNPNTPMIEEINNSNYEEVLDYISHSQFVDVTNGMRGKIEEIHQIRKRPIRCVVYNAFKKENTYNALKGVNVGTNIAFN